MVDKLDYCATLNNLTFAKDNPNFKVSADRLHPLCSCCDGLIRIFSCFCIVPTQGCSSDLLKHTPVYVVCKSYFLLLQFIKGDIQSGDLLSYILETEKIDTVMHFAAQVCPCAISLLTVVTAPLETYCSPAMQPCAQGVQHMNAMPSRQRCHSFALLFC